MTTKRYFLNELLAKSEIFCIFAHALDQIDRKGYADKYTMDGRPVTKVGIVFSSEERNITDWQAK